MILEAEEILFLEESSFEYFSTLPSYTWKEVKYSVTPAVQSTNWKTGGFILSHNYRRWNQNVLVASPSNGLWYAFTSYH